MIKKKYVRVLFVLYLLLLVRIIVFKYPAERLREIAEGRLGIYSFGNLVGNVLAFVPLGFMLPLLSEKLKKCLFCLGTGLFVVLAIELFQLWTAFGCFDVDDILLNGIGVWLGWVVFRIGSRLFSKTHPAE